MELSEESHIMESGDQYKSFHFPANPENPDSDILDGFREEECKHVFSRVWTGDRGFNGFRSFQLVSVGFSWI